MIQIRRNKFTITTKIKTARIIKNNTTCLSLVNVGSAPGSGSRYHDNPFVLVLQFPDRCASDRLAERDLHYRQKPLLRPMMRSEFKHIKRLIITLIFFN